MWVRERESTCSRVVRLDAAPARVIHKHTAHWPISTGFVLSVADLTPSSEPGQPVALGSLCDNPIMDPNEAIVESWMLALHDKSDGTRTLYRSHLRYLTTWLAENDRTVDLLEVDRRDIEAWFASAGDLSQNTRRSRWISLRSFFGWAFDEEEIDTNPMAKVKVARADEPPPEVVPLDQLKLLLKACEGRDFYARRDTALVRLFIATGARLNEVASMQLADVDLAARLATIQKGKGPAGGKRRVVRFDATTAAAIDRYKRSRARHRAAGQPWLWLGLKDRLTKSGIDAALNRRATAAGIEGFHVHLLRHTWADRWKSNGGSEEALMTLGGWEDTTVMRRYGSARAVDRALQSYDTIDPMAGL